MPRKVGKKAEVVLPFSGFYETMHDSELDSAMNQMFADDSGNENGELSMRFWNGCDWQKAHELYAADYTENIMLKTGLKSLKFVTLDSPREYNFTTDRIFASISRKDIRTMYRDTDRERLVKLAIEEFTSCDGFASRYDPDIKAWGRVDYWDHNQLGCLMQAYMDEHHSSSSEDGFDFRAEADLMDDSRGNGVFDNILCEAFPDKKLLHRLFAVREYLQKRSER